MSAITDKGLEKADTTLEHLDAPGANGIRNAFRIKLIHNDSDESEGCRCISHCTCDCDRKTL